MLALKREKGVGNLGTLLFHRPLLYMNVQVGNLRFVKHNVSQRMIERL